jgi:hypothetical protein
MWTPVQLGGSLAGKHPAVARHGGDRRGDGKGRLGRDEARGALKRLDEQARRPDGQVSGPPFAQLVEEERLDSHNYAGRSVFGWEPPPPARTGSG